MYQSNIPLSIRNDVNCIRSPINNNEYVSCTRNSVLNRHYISGSKGLSDNRNFYREKQRTKSDNCVKCGSTPLIPISPLFQFSPLNLKTLRKPCELTPTISKTWRDHPGSLKNIYRNQENVGDEPAMEKEFSKRYHLDSQRMESRDRGRIGVFPKKSVSMDSRQSRKILTKDVKEIKRLKNPSFSNMSSQAPGINYVESTLSSVPIAGQSSFSTMNNVHETKFINDAPIQNSKNVRKSIVTDQTERNNYRKNRISVRTSVSNLTKVQRAQSFSDTVPLTLNYKISDNLIDKYDEQTTKSKRGLDRDFSHSSESVARIRSETITSFDMNNDVERKSVNRILPSEEYSIASSDDTINRIGSKNLKASSIIKPTKTAGKVENRISKTSNAINSSESIPVMRKSQISSGFNPTSEKITGFNTDRSMSLNKINAKSVDMSNALESISKKPSEDSVQFDQKGFSEMRNRNKIQASKEFDMASGSENLSKIGSKNSKINSAINPTEIVSINENRISKNNKTVNSSENIRDRGIRDKVSLVSENIPAMSNDKRTSNSKGIERKSVATLYNEENIMHAQSISVNNYPRRSSEFDKRQPRLFEVIKDYDENVEHSNEKVMVNISIQFDGEKFVESKGPKKVARGKSPEIYQESVAKNLINLNSDNLKEEMTGNEMQNSRFIDVSNVSNITYDRQSKSSKNFNGPLVSEVIVGVTHGNSKSDFSEGISIIGQESKPVKGRKTRSISKQSIPNKIDVINPSGYASENIAMDKRMSDDLLKRDSVISARSNDMNHVGSKMRKGRTSTVTPMINESIANLTGERELNTGKETDILRKTPRSIENFMADNENLVNQRGRPPNARSLLSSETPNESNTHGKSLPTLQKVPNRTSVVLHNRYDGIKPQQLSNGIGDSELLKKLDHCNDFNNQLKNNIQNLDVVIVELSEKLTKFQNRNDELIPIIKSQMVPSQIAIHLNINTN